MPKFTAVLLFLCMFPVRVFAFSVEHDFNVRLGVFNASDTTFTYALTPGGYAVSSEVATAGFFDTLYPFKAVYSTTGKIKNGVVKACEKRPVSIARIDELVDGITKRVYNSMEQEISSKAIGEMVMDALKDLDEVAYVRYASVYRSFTDISSFMTELQKMMATKKA